MVSTFDARFNMIERQFVVRKNIRAINALESITLEDAAPTF
ncbi:MAG TPA: hypothetical protein VM100_11795 [Longimicrobiales bacterium]|nr:hypothetical protein [Longimicrobiales bacterium]